MDTNTAIPDGMDAGAVNLARAIRQQESGGNYNAVGDNNTSAGAYQWSNGTDSPLAAGGIPANFQTDAKQYGLDPNDFSAKNQDMVAYQRILDLKNQGKNVLQIASLWNSGDENKYDPTYVSPDGTPSVGTTTINGKQVAYNVPAYVKSVNDYYQNLKNGGTTTQTSTPTTIQPNPSFTGIGSTGLPLADTSIEGGTPVVANKNTPSTISALGDVGKGLVSGTVASGQDIAAAIGGGSLIDKYEKMNEADQNVLTTYITLRNKAATAGDTAQLAHYNNLIKNYKLTTGESATDVFPALNKSNEQVLGDFASMGLEIVGAAEGAQGLGELTGLAAKTGADTVVPSALKRFGTAAMTGAGYGAAFGGAGALQNNEDATGIAKATAVGGITGAATGLGVEGVASAIGSIGGKSAEEILATPKEDVNKLPARAQKLWYQNQASSIRETASDLTSKAQEAGQQSLKDTTDEINQFKQQIGSASREETIAMKPKAQQMMKNASQEYISLTGEATDGSPALKKTITTADLSNKIDSKFEYNPEIASALKNDLGIKPPEAVAEGEATPPEQTLTNQQILDKARSLMQDVSKTARTGGKVYSPAEYQAMQKYSFLMETLGDNGVDMTEANKFWKQWAPVRDRIVREIKPFDDADIAKMPFTSTLQRAGATPTTPGQAASKLDAQNFINEIETRLKVPKGTIGSDTQDLIQQMEKAKLSKDATKEVTTEALAKIKADKTEALKTMKLSQYNGEKASRNRKIITSVIGTILGLGVLGKGAIEKAVSLIP